MTIVMEADLKKGVLTAFDNALEISCIVRNEINGWRKLDQIVRSIPDNRPIQPRTFPKGLWTLGKPEPKSDPYMAPYFIPTDAWQYMPIWELDGDGHYKKATTKMTKDRGYGLHYSESGSTQGCIKIVTVTDLIWLVNTVVTHQAQGDVIKLEVV